VKTKQISGQNLVWSALFSIALSICAILSTTPVFGQALSIKKTDTNYWIEASAGTGESRTLQESDNLHLWVDIHDVQEPYSFAFDTAGVSERYFRLPPSVPPAPPIRVMIIGDSMDSDCCGWGGGIYRYFKPNVTVVNYSQPSTTTQAFLQSAELDKMMLLEPQYVLMQFAWSDGAAVGGVSRDDFAANLREIVRIIRGFNGIPILINLHAAREWDAEGNLSPWEHPYNVQIRAVSTELNTPFVDLYQITRVLFNELGPTGVAFMHADQFGPEDVMHVSPLGAVYVSRLLTHYLPDSLGPYLTGIFDPPPRP
jgi:lysophospholipase L1-like esterase